MSTEAALEPEVRLLQQLPRQARLQQLCAAVDSLSTAGHRGPTVSPSVTVAMPGDCSEDRVPAGAAGSSGTAPGAAFLLYCCRGISALRPASKKGWPRAGGQRAGWEQSAALEQRVGDGEASQGFHRQSD